MDEPIFKETWIDQFTVVVEGLTPEAVEIIEEYKNRQSTQAVPGAAI